MERNEIAGDSRPKDRRLRGCSGKTWPSQTRQLGNEAQSPIAGQQPPIVGLQAATVNRQSTCRAGKFVRRHVAIVIAAYNHFPAHYDFIDRSKKSAEVRMSDRLQYSGCHRREAEAIAPHTCEKYSGRVGRPSSGIEEVDPSDYWPVYSPTLVLPVPLQPVAP